MEWSGGESAHPRSSGTRPLGGYWEERPQVGKLFHEDEGRVRFWIKRFFTEGFDGLEDPPHPDPGQRSNLTPALRAAVRAEWAQGDRIWTLAQIADWLAAEHGLQLSPDPLKTGVGSWLSRAFGDAIAASCSGWRQRIPVPEVVSAFWMVLGGVSLVDLERYRHVAFWEGRGIEGARQFCDGFHVHACDSDWEEYTLQTFEAFRDDDALDEFRYELAPDGYHKDDISGGPPYGVGRLHEWAPAWENFDWSGYRRPQSAPPDPPDFLSYVRTAILECAGFPGLFGHPEFEPLRRSLVEKLEPF